MNAELRDRVLLGVGAAVAVVISYTLYTGWRQKTTEGIRDAVSRPVDVPKAPPIPGLKPGEPIKYLDASAGRVNLNGPVGPAR